MVHLQKDGCNTWLTKRGTAACGQIRYLAATPIRDLSEENAGQSTEERAGRSTKETAGRERLEQRAEESTEQGAELIRARHGRQRRAQAEHKQSTKKGRPRTARGQIKGL